VTPLQVSIRESGDVAILDLRGRWTADVAEKGLLKTHLQKLIPVSAVLSRPIVFLVVLAVISEYYARAVTRWKCSGCYNLLEIVPSFENENVALASFTSRGCLAKP